MSVITQTQFQDMMSRNLTPFRQDVADSEHTIGSPQAIVAGTEYRLTIDGLARNAVQAPDYMTDRWTDDKLAVPTEYDKPTYVGDVGLVFDPTTASGGFATLRIYIDDATTPKLIRTYIADYKGPSANPLNIVTTWYWGDEAGFDAKNDGIYFTVEFDDSGSLYNKSVVIYHTQ